MSFTWMALIQLSLIQTQNIQFIDIMRDQIDIEDMGGTLRLGLYPCKLKPGSKAAAAYGNQEVVQRRHRHRYEFNTKFREQFEAEALYSQVCHQIIV